MTLGVFKQNTIDSFKICIDKKFFEKEDLQARIVSLIKYDDVIQEDIDELLNLLNPPKQNTIKMGLAKVKKIMS